jgi:outer membrane protein OmpA-like peptidoglycan-associated protein
MRKLILIATAAAVSGCVTQPTSQVVSSAVGGAGGAAPVAPAQPGCKPLNGGGNASASGPETATVVGAVGGALIGALAGRGMASNKSVGTRNGLLLGALVGGLAGSRYAASIKTVEQPDGSVKLDIPGSVLFPSGSFAINDGFKSTLDSVGRTINEYCGLRAEVIGHTDSVGRPADNKVLSMNRARSVVSYLGSIGVPGDRLMADGVGPDRPVADNATEAGRQQNRRVEIFVRAPLN